MSSGTSMEGYGTPEQPDPKDGYRVDDGMGMGHYIQHIDANVQSGATHLPYERAKNTTHAVVLSSQSMAKTPNPLPKPQIVNKIAR